MAIFTIQDGVIEADFDQIVQRWLKNENEVIGTSNNIDCCPIANLLEAEFEYSDASVNVFQIGVWFYKQGEIQHFKPSERLIDFIQAVDDYYSHEDEDDEETVYEQENVPARVGVEIIKTLRLEAQQEQQG